MFLQAIATVRAVSKFALNSLWDLTATTAAVLYKSYVTDGATAVGHALDTANTLANAAALLLDVRNGGTSKFSVSRAGLANASQYVDAIGLGGMSLYGGLTIPATLTLVASGGVPVATSYKADGAASIGHKADTNAAYSTAGAQVAAWHNGGTQKLGLTHFGGLYLVGMTTAARDALAGADLRAGTVVYNTSTNKLNFYNGSAWEVVTSA